MSIQSSIRSFLAPPVFEGEAEKTRVASLLNTVLLSLFLVPLVVAVNAVFIPAIRTPGVRVIILLTVTLLTLRYAMRRGYVRAVSAVVVAGMTVLLGYLAVLNGGEVRPGNGYFALVIVIAALLLGGRGALASAAASAVVLGLVTYLGAAGRITPRFQPPPPAIAWLTQAAGFVLVGVVLRLASRSLGAALRLARQSRSDLQALAGSLEQRVADRTRTIALLNELSVRLQACLTSEEAYAVVARLAPSLFPDEDGALYILDQHRNQMEPVAAWGEAPPEGRAFDVRDCWGLRLGRLNVVEQASRVVGHAHADPQEPCRHVAPAQPAAYMCMPLTVQGQAYGLLHWRASRPLGAAPGAEMPGHWFSEVKQQLAQTVSDNLTLALTSLQLRETLRQQSIRDPVTGLFNRRYMEETLEREIWRAARSQGPVSIIMLDIDHFKQFNDTFGHEAGDVVLREIGACLRAQIRAEDIACRYGGEEFTLIMPAASIEVARHRAEHILDQVKRLAVHHHGHALGQITASLGVAMYPEHGETGEAVLAAADAALYRAKHAGRDRVLGALAGEGAAPHR